MSKRNSWYLPVFFVAIACIIPLALVTRSLSFRFDTDYKVIVPEVQFAINAVKDPLHFFAWNPYIGLGMPPLGDPTSIIFSPWYMPIFFLFGADWGIRVLIAVSMIAAGFTMWVFLSSLRIKHWIAAWGAMLYEVSGAFAALVTSGRIERFGSYAVTPYVMYLFWKPFLTTAQQISIGIIYACMFLSSDVYTPWLASVLYVCLTVYKFARRQQTLKYIVKEVCIIYGFFLIFSLPKLLPFIFYVKPYFKRPWSVNPFDGSLQIWLLPLSYIIPWRVAFFDRPFLQRHLGFYFNWYEYFAFISVIPFVFLYKLRGVWKKREVQYAILLIIVGGLYLALKYPYSPFYWLFHYVSMLNVFHVPQRIVGILLVPILVLLCYCLDSWVKKIRKKRKTVLYILCVLSVFWTYAVSIRTMRDAFESVRANESAVARELRARDQSDYYVLDFTCCIQPFLIRESIPILNFYYGWMPAYTPRFTNADASNFDYTQLRNTKPSYIITDNGAAFDEYGYALYFGSGTITVWKASQPTIFPSL